SSSTFKSIFVGVGPLLCYPHVGGGYSSSETSSSNPEKFIDVNGDGLPDFVRSDGTVLINHFFSSNGVTDHNHGYFTPAGGAGLPLPTEINPTSGSTKSVGVHFLGELGGGGSETDSRVAQTADYVDMDGDGKPDYFTGVNFYQNQSSGSTVAF